MNGTGKTKLESLPKLPIGAGSETLPAVSSAQPLSTLEAISHSQSLLDKSTEHMLKLMKGLTHHDYDPETAATLLDPGRVQAACLCAKNIRDLLKVKLEAIELARGLKPRE